MWNVHGERRDQEVLGQERIQRAGDSTQECQWLTERIWSKRRSQRRFKVRKLGKIKSSVSQGMTRRRTSKERGPRTMTNSIKKKGGLKGLLWLWHWSVINYVKPRSLHESWKWKPSYKGKDLGYEKMEALRYTIPKMWPWREGEKWRNILRQKQG